MEILDAVRNIPAGSVQAHVRFFDVERRYLVLCTVGSAEGDRFAKKVFATVLCGHPERFGFRKTGLNTYAWESDLYRWKMRVWMDEQGAPYKAMVVNDMGGAYYFRVMVTPKERARYLCRDTRPERRAWVWKG